ncbi:hypothetical protein [Gracilimonas tropica]|uniref:hypothetical protein n=1 Tax=Gracilimonas tropica TaxID=454600 RepID=UPI000375891D|nr:hypothetical protein [Gracilimonas tropica]
MEGIEFGPIQAKRLLEEIVECREKPLIVIQVGRQNGKTFAMKQAIKMMEELNMPVIPSENIKRPKNEIPQPSPPRPFYIPKPTRSNR